MTSIIPEASTATPDPRAQRDDETIYETVAREAAERKAGRPPRPCTVYTWCEEIDTHEDHSGPELLVRSYDETAEPLAWACISYLSDSVPCVGLNGADLTAEQAREKAQELRQLADAVDEMADTLDAVKRAHVDDVIAFVRERQANATGPLADALDAMANLIVKTGDPDAVAELVLGVTTRVEARA